EVTALGAAFLAGLAVGFWDDLEEVRSKAVIEREFQPAIAADKRDAYYHGWQKAVARARAWEEPGELNNR
ncbi:glycerol kinase, partial [Martelella alba]